MSCTSTQLALIVGLGVVTPVVVMAFVGGVVLLVYCIRKRRRNRSKVKKAYSRRYRYDNKLMIQ